MEVVKPGQGTQDAIFQIGDHRGEDPEGSPRPGGELDDRARSGECSQGRPDFSGGQPGQG